MTAGPVMCERNGVRKRPDEDNRKGNPARMTDPTRPADLTADPDRDDLIAAVRQLEDRFATEADRYSRLADDYAADGLPAAAELARRRADDYEIIVRNYNRPAE